MQDLKFVEYMIEKDSNHENNQTYGNEGKQACMMMREPSIQLVVSL